MSTTAADARLLQQLGTRIKQLSDSGSNLLVPFVKDLDHTLRQSLQSSPDVRFVLHIASSENRLHKRRSGQASVETTDQDDSDSTASEEAENTTAVSRAARASTRAATKAAVLVATLATTEKRQRVQADVVTPEQEVTNFIVFYAQFPDVFDVETPLEELEMLTRDFVDIAARDWGGADASARIALLKKDGSIGEAIDTVWLATEQVDTIGRHCGKGVVYHWLYTNVKAPNEIDRKFAIRMADTYHRGMPRRFGDEWNQYNQLGSLVGVCPRMWKWALAWKDYCIHYKAIAQVLHAVSASSSHADALQICPWLGRVPAFKQETWRRMARTFFDKEA